MSAPLDPLVTAVVIAVATIPGDRMLTEAEVLVAAAPMRRLSSVIAAARSVATAYAGPGLAGRDYDPDEVGARVADLCNALAAADSAG